MSAPNLPRFITGSVTGYPITQQGGGSHHRPTTVWYVWDAWCGFAIVRSFIGQRAKRRAQALALQLESENAEDLKLTGRGGEANLRPDRMDPRPVAIHGDLSTYNNLGCRCDACKAAKADYRRYGKADARV